MMFRSFFLAGFECATGVNRRQQRFDQIAATGHDAQLEGDYRLLREQGILAIREGIRWPLVDREGSLDGASVLPFLKAARRQGLEVIWDLFHYGYPPDLDPFAPAFAQRFSNYCRAMARLIREESDAPWYFTPMNEPSYFSWAAGEAGRFAPHLRQCGRQLKIALIRAAIQGIDAIRAVCPGARMVSVDPLCRVVPPRGRDDLLPGAEHFNQHAVYEAWDMLAGRLLPELGGSREHLDIIGINYYHANQWEIGREDLPLAHDDPRRLPLRELVGQVWQRYRRDGGELLITETSDVGERRAGWLDGVADEAVALLEQGVPLGGVCLYPILGMPEWHDRGRWTAMGLWDLDRGDGLRRVLHAPMAQALRRAAERLETLQPGAAALLPG
jgi:hypothetical protein